MHGARSMSLAPAGSNSILPTGSSATVISSGWELPGHPSRQSRSPVVTGAMPTMNSEWKSR